MLEMATWEREQMGLFEFTELVQQQDPQEHPKERRNPFGGLIDGAKGLVNKGRDQFEKLDEQHQIRDKAAATGRVVGDVAKGVGQSYVQQGKEIAGSAGRELRGEGTAADRQVLINAGKTAAGLYLGGAPAILLNSDKIGGNGRGGLPSIPTDAQTYKDIYGAAQRSINGQGTEADRARLIDAGRQAAGIVAPNNPLVKADAMFGRGLPQLDSRGDQGSVYGQVVERGAQALNDRLNNAGGRADYTSGGLANFNPEAYRDRMRHLNPGAVLGNSFPRLSNDQIIEKASNIAGDKLGQAQKLTEGGSGTLISGTTFDMSKVGGRQFAQNIDGNKIIKGLGGLIGGIVEDGTRVNTAEFVQNVSENFDKLDADKDGRISADDLKAVKADDPIFSVANLHLMNFMERNLGKLSNMSNDDLFSEKGIARGDIDALGKAKDGTGYGVLGNALSGAWDGKYAAIVAGAGAGIIGSGSAAARAGRAGIAVAGVAVVTGLYDGFDYYSNRKGNIEAMISELK